MSGMPKFQIGQSVLYQEYVFGRPLSENIYSAVVVDIFTYGGAGVTSYGSYYIRFDGDVVPPCGYQGLSQTIASQNDLTAYTRSENYAENNAAWLSQVKIFDAELAEEKAKAEAVYIAEMTAKYAHIVPGLLVKWKVVDCQYGGYNSNSYEGTVVSTSPGFYCLVHCTDGHDRSVKMEDL
jgi:hypothetical protein